MKKIITAATLIFGIAFLFGCGGGDSEISEEEANNRISALQSAINTLSYTAYMTCFDDSTNMYDSYREADFLAEYPGGIQYIFGTLTINGNTVTCDSTKTGFALPFSNVFEMVETDGDWYISLWTEDGTTIFNNPRRARK